MAKPILYGAPPSPAVRAVLLTASAMDLDYEFKLINPQNNETKTEEYLKMNPQHTIPTLEDDGKYIWDSHAIITYLAGKYGKDDSLYPEDLFTRAIIDQRLHFESSVLGPRMFGFGGARQTGDSEQIEKAKARLEEAYDFLEKFLDGNTYMVGDTLTVADFSIVATLSTVNAFTPIDEEQFPNLFAWLDRMSQLPYYEESNNQGLQQLIEYFTKKWSEQVES